MHYRHNMLQMGAAGQFGHYASVLFMNGLIGNKIRQDLSVPANGGRSFITTGFYGEDGGHFSLSVYQSISRQYSVDFQLSGVRKIKGFGLMLLFVLLASDGHNRVHSGGLTGRNKAGQYANDDTDNNGQCHIGGRDIDREIEKIGQHLC